MKSFCLAYVQQGRTICYFCPNCSNLNSKYIGFLVLKFEHSLLKKFNLIFRLLSAVCFCDHLATRIMIFSAIDSTVCFLSLSVF